MSTEFVTSLLEKFGCLANHFINKNHKNDSIAN
jgi:hypothetical protein